MKILLINLEKSHERRKFQLAQAERLGLSLEIIPAVDKEAVPEEMYRALYQSWERPMLRTEMACFMSHCNAWRKVQQSQQPALILEDDAVLSKKLPSILQALQAANEPMDHVSLETRGRKKMISKSSSRIVDAYALKKLFQDRTGAAAYVLWPSGASKLLRNVQNRAGLADAVICASYNLSSFQVEPAAAIQADRCEKYGIVTPINPQTTIDSTHASRLEASSKRHHMHCKLRRLASQLKMAIRQLAKLGISERKEVLIEKTDFIF